MTLKIWSYDEFLINVNTVHRYQCSLFLFILLLLLIKYLFLKLKVLVYKSLVRLRCVTCNQQLIQNKIRLNNRWTYLMKIEYQIKLTYISKVLVQNLYESVNHFKSDKLILILVDNSYEIETRISFVYDFVLFVLKKIAHFGLSGYY